MENDILELTAEIVSAYVGNNSVPASQLPDLIASVNAALQSLNGAPQAEPAAPVPPVSIKKSVTPDYIISMEDGRRYKALKRHLSSRGISPEQYRAKWNLPADYPMIAPAYSTRRSEVAKALGLGRKPGATGPQKKKATKSA